MTNNYLYLMFLCIPCRSHDQQGDGWEKLSSRREVTIKKICMFYELNVSNSPEFLYDLIPPIVGETNNSNLRNRLIISQTSNRLSIYQQSFSLVDDQVMEFIIY